MTRRKKASNKKPAARSTAENKSKRTSKTTAKAKKPAKKSPTSGKNVSKTIPNGQLIITNDQYFYGADGKSKKVRMSTVVDSNKKNELAIVKYTTSTKHGRPIQNNKGFKAHGDKIYTLDNERKPIKIDNQKFSTGNNRRNITRKQANEIKRRNIKESRYKAGNRSNLQNLKGRKKEK